VARHKRIQSVFLNIPYDTQFEQLYVAYIVGLTQLGLKINATLAVPNQGRLERIVEQIEESDVSIHDLSRIETSAGIPRFNMPLELGLALYRSHLTKGRHRVFVFEEKAFRTQHSTSDINGIDPQIHRGKPQGIMAGLRNIFYRADGITVPEMLSSYNAVKRKLPELRRNAGSQSLFEASIFNDLTVAALVERKRIIDIRGALAASPKPVV
jgi:hypothetical protein